MKKSLLALCAGILALGASAETYKVGEAFTYEINPEFQWFDNDEELFSQNANWPALALQGGASMAEGWGTAMFWFAQMMPETLEAAQEWCPVVEDPWNRGDYALKMHADAWWAYGNFNMALPKVDEVCRIRVIYRVDTEGYDQYNPTNGKPFHVRLTDSDQDGCFTEPIYEEQVETYWTNPGYRVIDLYYNLPTAQTYLALTWDGQGLSCGGGRPAFYLEEVSVVPVSKLEGDTHTTGNVVASIVPERPALTVVEGEGGEGAINEIGVAAQNAIYDLQGRKVAKADKGLYIINGVKTLVK